MIANSSTEMVSYNQLNSNSIYKIKIQRYTSEAEPVYYAYAWTTDTVAQNYEYRLPSDTYQDTGAYFIVKESDKTALSPYNRQATPGIPVAWEPWSVTRDAQKWYLEKINYRKGDVDADGTITSTDLAKMNQYISGTIGLSGIQQYLADLNNDGIIDTQDRIILNNMLNN